MANVLSSSVSSDPAAQVDGRRWVYQLFNLSDGSQLMESYLAAVGHDTAAALAAKVSFVEAILTGREIERNVSNAAMFGSLAPAPSLKFSTVAQNGAAARAFYLTATRIEAVMLGDYLSTLSNPILVTAFAMTNAQVNTLRTNKLTPAAALAADIRAATGA